MINTLIHSYTRRAISGIFKREAHLCTVKKLNMNAVYIQYIYSVNIQSIKFCYNVFFISSFDLHSCF